MAKSKITFTQIMTENGFRHTGDYSDDGSFIYTREWRREIEVLWYGLRETTYRIEAYEYCGHPIVELYEDGRPLGHRIYTSSKRAMNAIHEIIRCAGYAM